MRRAEAGLSSILAQLAREFPKPSEGWRICCRVLACSAVSDADRSSDSRSYLMTVAGMVLLVACVNLASLLWRARRTAVRKPQFVSLLARGVWIYSGNC